MLISSVLSLYCFFFFNQVLVLILFLKVQETVASEKGGLSLEEMGQILYQIPDMVGASVFYFSGEEE